MPTVGNALLERHPVIAGGKLGSWDAVTLALPWHNAFCASRGLAPPCSLYVLGRE
jgi:hypothetical protein